MDIPLEIFSYILSFLSPKEWFNLRLTSKEYFCWINHDLCWKSCVRQTKKEGTWFDTYKRHISNSFWVESWRGYFTDTVYGNGVYLDQTFTSKPFTSQKPVFRVYIKKLPSRIGLGFAEKSFSVKEWGLLGFEKHCKNVGYISDKGCVPCICEGGRSRDFVPIRQHDVIEISYMAPKLFVFTNGNKSIGWYVENAPRKILYPCIQNNDGEVIIL